MRLSPQEKQSIHSCIIQKDPKARIYLYGSRTQDNFKGGDIDLLVLSEILKFSDKIDLLVAIKEKIGDQKIDLTIKSLSQAQADAFFKEVLEKSLEIK